MKNVFTIFMLLFFVNLVGLMIYEIQMGLEIPGLYRVGLVVGLLGFVYSIDWVIKEIKEQL